MSVIGYLNRRAMQAVLRETEKASIHRSLATLRTKLNLYLGYPTTCLMVFGSFRRGTILPRAMDPESDVDFMVAFRDGGFKPQTYLDRLRRFVETRYQRSEIYQSNPTIVLELNHIMFELVPAIPCTGHDFLIPEGPDRWQITEPLAFQRLLERRNHEERHRLKPAIRLLKFWNASNGYPWDSYRLEQWAATQTYWGDRNITDYLFGMINSLPRAYDAQWKAERVERAKKLVENVRGYLHYHYDVTAEQEVKKLIPE